MSHATNRADGLGRALLREPLLHFVLLGGLVFGADQLAASRRANPQLIVVGPEIEEEARSVFRSAQGRDPSPAELAILREHWIDTEVLYREGLALRLDQGDRTLRERVVFKALSVIDSNLRLPEPESDALRTWFEAHREQYDTPARFDFSEAVPAAPASEQRARAFAAALNGAAPGALPDELRSDLRIFEKRPRQTIAASFGAEFAAALEAAPLREWQVLPGKDGPHIARLESREPGTEVSFESVRGRVLQDWRDSVAQELRTAAVRELAKKYTVQLAGTPS